MKNKEPKIPYHEKVATEIIKSLKEGTAPWIKPWEPGTQPPGPVNALTGKPYRGWNRVHLTMGNNSFDNRWCTYKQATELGGQVRSKEKGTVIQYWKFSESTLLKDDKGKPILDDKGEKQYETRSLEKPRAFHAVVFHASQIDNMPPLPPQNNEIIKNEWERHEEAEKILSHSGANIFHDQVDRAYYAPMKDEIHLPQKGQFSTPDKYYATALHELGHWTGHESRLDRDLVHPFGSQAYAKEELRAEIASYMLGADLGIGHDPGQHTAYIAGWIKKLEEDPLEIFRAARDAQQITDYVQGLALEQNIEHNLTLEPTLMTRTTLEKSDMKISNQDDKTQSEQIAAQKTWLHVPYKEKDEAKNQGAKWDKEEKSWYVPEGNNISKLGKWLKPDIQPVQIDPQVEFKEALEAAGLNIEGMPIMDGKTHRVTVEGGKAGAKDGAYRGHLDGHPAGYINNFKTGYKHFWKSEGQHVDTKDVERLKAVAEERNKERAAEQQNLYKSKSAEVTERFNLLKSVDGHAYLTDKKIKNSECLGVKINDENKLVIPLKDENGKIWNLQKIGENGFKGFEKDGRVKSCYHVIGDLENSASQGEPILISTGFATAASIYQSTNKPVVVTFQDSNLKEVAESFHERYPNNTKVILGDDDRHLLDRVPPLPNSGREAAEAAAEAVEGIAVLPTFLKNEQDLKLTDFSDLMKSRGEDAVKRQIENAIHIKHSKGKLLDVKRTPAKNQKVEPKKQTANTL